MTTSRWVRTLERIPFGDRRDLGGGCAMGVAAILATAAWYAAVRLLRRAGGLGPVTMEEFDVAVAGSGYVVPIVSGSAVLVGTLLWGRFAPSTPDPRRGAVLGGATALTCMALGSLGVGLLGFVLVVGGETGLAAPQLAVAAAAVAALTFVFAVLFAGWFVVPLGALAGWYHERLLRSAPRDAAVRRAVE